MILKTEVMDIDREESSRNWNIEGIKELLQLIDQNLETVIFTWNAGEKIDITKLSDGELITLTFLELSPLLSGFSNLNAIDGLLSNFTELTERFLFYLGKKTVPDESDKKIKRIAQSQARRKYFEFIKEHNFLEDIPPDIQKMLELL